MVILYLVFLSNFLPSSTMFLVIVVCTHFDHFADICGHPAANRRPQSPPPRLAGLPSIASNRDQGTETKLEANMLRPQSAAVRILNTLEMEVGNGSFYITLHLLEEKP